MNNFYLLLAFVTGASVAAQSVIHSRLRLQLGSPIWAAAAQFIVGPGWRASHFCCWE